MFSFLTISFAHRDKKDQTQVLPTYEVFFFELHNNCNKYTYGAEHAHVCRYTQNNYTCQRELENRRNVFCGHNDRVGYIYL